MSDESDTTIQSVQIVPLKQIVDERGAVLHMLRADAPFFTQFGEIYFSVVNPGVVKAWKRHQRMTQRITVPVGRIRIVIYDDRPDSQTQRCLAVHELGRPDAYHLLIIPPLLWYGFQGLSEAPSIIANCPDIPHDPGEVEYLNQSTDLIPYAW